MKSRYKKMSWMDIRMENRGKAFERKIKEAFLKVPGVSVDRLHDQTSGYLGSSNICDFIVYKKPYEYYIECKTVHGNTLSIHGTDEKHKYGNITNAQWEGLLEKSNIPGVHAGVIVWWVDHDATGFFPIQMLKDLRDVGYKSLNIHGDWINFYEDWQWHWILGEKKRVFFEYDMSEFFDRLGGYSFQYEWEEE